MWFSIFKIARYFQNSDGSKYFCGLDNSFLKRTCLAQWYLLFYWWSYCYLNTRKDSRKLLLDESKSLGMLAYLKFNLEGTAWLMGETLAMDNAWTLVEPSGKRNRTCLNGEWSQGWKMWAKEWCGFLLFPANYWNKSGLSLGKCYMRVESAEQILKRRLIIGLSSRNRGLRQPNQVMCKRVWRVAFTWVVCGQWYR